MSFQDALKRKQKQKPFDPTREASIDNPLPDSIWDKKTGAFKGYKPKSMGIPVESGGSASVNMPPPAPKPSSLGGDDRAKTPGGRVLQDLKETFYDLKDEPEEVPYRVKERIKDYFGLPPARQKRGLRNVGSR